MSLPTLDSVTGDSVNGWSGYVGPFSFGTRVYFWQGRSGIPQCSLFIGSALVGTVGVE